MNRLTLQTASDLSAHNTSLLSESTSLMQAHAAKLLAARGKPLVTLDELSPNPVMLAPMVGLTHYAVRSAVHSFLPQNRKVLWPTEMLNSRRIPSQQVNESPEMNFMDVANGLCPQLLANEENFIRLAVPRLEHWGVKAIDINMGCPVHKALKHNYGVALMGDPEYAAQVVSMTVQNATVPVSVKLRAGFREGAENDEAHFQSLVSFISGLFDAGASWVTIHPRTAEQKRKGDADFFLLAKLIKALRNAGYSQPIIANGDVQQHQDIQKIFEITGASRVMVGRAMIVKPWLIANEPEPDAFTQGEWYGKFLMKVLDECEAHYVEKQGLRRLRFLVTYGKPWVQYGEYLLGRTMAANTYAETRSAFEKFFSQPQKIEARTHLRS